MSGLLGVTGFSSPFSLSGFAGLLQTASFRGVPFKVIASQIKKGRKIAVHDYPFRDGVWSEDMGRAARTYSFTGYLVGDLGPAMQLLLDTVAEKPGPGLLIHPTVGAQQVCVLSYSTSVSKDAMRVIEVNFEFIEAGSRSLIATIIATVASVLLAASGCIAAIGSSLGSSGGPAAVSGSAAVGEGVSVITRFGSECAISGADPGALVSIAVGIQPPDNDTTYGRYAAGNASIALPSGSTVASLQAQATTQLAAVATASTAAVSAAAGFSTATAPAMAAALSALVEAARMTMTDPADQIRVLLNLAQFPYTDTAGGSGIGGDMAAVRDAMSAACRRAALISLANAAAAYQPLSYQDAQNIIDLISAALDVEITAAGDAGDDDIYDALRTMRAAIVQDLTTRGATLPQVVTVTFGVNLPVLVAAQILYQDASRSDEIAAEAGMPHPAFCPASMQVLSA